MISLPNVRYWNTFWQLGVRGRWPRQPDGIFDRTHLRWFTGRDAVDLVGEAGLGARGRAPRPPAAALAGLGVGRARRPRRRAHAAARVPRLPGRAARAEATRSREADDLLRHGADQVAGRPEQRAYADAVARLVPLALGALLRATAPARATRSTSRPLAPTPTICIGIPVLPMPATQRSRSRRAETGSPPG